MGSGRGFVGRGFIAVTRIHSPQLPQNPLPPDNHTLTGVAPQSFQFGNHWKQAAIVGERKILVNLNLKQRSPILASHKQPPPPSIPGDAVQNVFLLMRLALSNRR